MPKKADMNLRAHEQVCTERYGNIYQSLIEIKQNQTTYAVQNDTRFASMASEHRQAYNALSNRMWAILITSLGGLITVCGGVVFYLVTAGKH